MSDERPEPTGLSHPDDPKCPERATRPPDGWAKGLLAGDSTEFEYWTVTEFHDLTCEHCQRPFQSPMSTTRWCSPYCRTKSWSERNPAKLAGYGRNRSSLLDSGTLTDNEWLEILAITGKYCFYCGGVFEHMEHVIPLSRGGPHDQTNVVPACQRCNQTKHVKLVHEWKSPPEALAIYERLFRLHVTLALAWGEPEGPDELPGAGQTSI